MKNGLSGVEEVFALVFFFKQKTAYEMLRSLVGSEMCIRDSINIANALGGTAAGLGLGLTRAAVVEGLRTFRPDPVLNSGRFNTYSVPLTGGGSATVVIDMAHNEAGLEALLEVCRGLTAPGGRVRLGIGGTGDRLPEANAALGEIAGRGADHVVLAHKLKYLRGMSLEQMDSLLRAGLARSGMAEVAGFLTEIEALTTLLAAAESGDVIGLMCHVQRDEVADLIAQRGGTVDDPRTIRSKVIAARGMHEAEDDIAAIWALTDAGERTRRVVRVGSDEQADGGVPDLLHLELSVGEEDADDRVDHCVSQPSQSDSRGPL